MPQFQRGVYEPGEDVRVFDGSEDEEDAEGSRLPLLIVLALLVLAMFGGVVWLAYTQGVARGRTETPVIAAASGPARVAPANPGGAEQPYKGFKIYEQPAPPDDDVAANAPALSPPPATKPAIVASAPPPAATPPAAALTPAPAPKPVAAPPKQTAAAPAKPVAPPKPVTAAPPPATAAEPATAAPRALASVAPPAAKPAGASGGYVLQIGAYKSQADADTAWNAYKRSHAALLAGYGPDVQKADLGDKGTWYRLRIAGFSDKDAASALCDRLKAEQGACFLGR
jgi:SPOR domain